MSEFENKFPHNIKFISPVRRYEEYSAEFRIVGGDMTPYQTTVVETFEMDLCFDDRTYRNLSNYVTEKLRLDDFIDQDPGARKLYDELLTYYHLRK